MSGWVNGTTNNYGLIVQDYGGTSADDLQFRSSEYSADNTYDPMLIVTYCRPWGILWDDADNDGLQEDGEAPIFGATVNLRNATTNALVASDTTDSMGRYIFTGLTNGTSYYVEFVAPSGASFSPQDQGGDDTVDSDVNPANGRSASFTWQSASSSFVIDAGVFSLCVTTSFQQGLLPTARYLGARDTFISQSNTAPYNQTYNFGVSTPLAVDSDEPSVEIDMDVNNLLYWDMSGANGTCRGYGHGPPSRSMWKMSRYLRATTCMIWLGPGWKAAGTGLPPATAPPGSPTTASTPGGVGAAGQAPGTATPPSWGTQPQLARELILST